MTTWTTVPHDRWPLVAFPGAKLLLHLLNLTGYGIFRDELYYIACSKRLAWGYVDHPPFSVGILRLVRELLGDDLWALRLVPALVGAAAVFVIGALARRLGGGTLAQSLAMLAALLGPSYLGVSHFYSMNVFDWLFWALAGYWIVELVQGECGSRAGWLRLGGLLGLGLLNKLSFLWLGLGLAVGLLAVARDQLRKPGPWLAAGLSGGIFLPHVLWQIRWGWPTREFMANATGHKMLAVSPLDFLAGQVDMLGGPVLFAVALAGLLFLFASAPGRGRILGWMYLTVFTLLLLNGTSRAGYLGPATSWLLAAGGVGLEALVLRLRAPWGRWALASILGALVSLQGLIAAPFGLPVLPVETFVEYSRALGVAPSTEERKELAQLPQFYADMFGWREKAEMARRAVDRLAPEERAVACFFATNYGVAGALEHFGGDDLPPVTSGHNNLWLWGPGSCTGEVMIVLGVEREALEAWFEEVERVDTVECRWCMPYENHQPVVVARRPRVTLAEAWPRLKHFD